MSARLRPLLRRFVGFTATGVVAYITLMAVAALFFPQTTGPGSGYPVAASLVAGLAAYHMVYRGGYARLRSRLGRVR